MIMRDPGDRWSSYHLYYHEDLDRAVIGFVLPTVLSVVSSGWIDRFFFIRYQLGGPHVRLRLRVASELQDVVDQTVRQQAKQFLESTPSAQSRDEEVIRKVNRAILAADPSETDETVYSDNTLLRFPFLPEVQRYGGPGLLKPSLDFFVISSVEALCFLRENPTMTPSRRLTAAAHFLSRQALGFSSDVDELLSLYTYATETWGEAFPSILERADEVFLRQQRLFFDIVRQELDQSLLSTPDPATSPLLSEAALRLSSALLGSTRSTRHRIGGSHLHMLANRLGLSNPEELYLGRQLTLTLQNIQTSDPKLWSVAQDALARRAATPNEDRRSVADLLPRALGELERAPSHDCFAR